MVELYTYKKGKNRGLAWKSSIPGPHYFWGMCSHGHFDLSAPRGIFFAHVPKHFSCLARSCSKALQ